MPKHTRTTNEALQYENAGDKLVDFFRSAAAQRNAVLSKSDNLSMLFADAYYQNKEIATQLIFWLRDARKGAGEKAAGRKLLNLLYEASPEFIFDNLDHIVDFGYWKDLKKLAKGTKEVTQFWAIKIKAKDRLASKWAPRLHSKDHELAVKLRDELGISNKEYRKMLNDNSDTVEQKMTQNLWEEIIYDGVPSIALKRYFKQFKKNDGARFEEWLNSDKSKANASVVYPHEVLALSIESEEHKLAQKMWDNLPNYVKKGEKFIPLVDVSGSMSGTKIGGKNSKIDALQVACALGMYLAERNISIFKDHFITFSSNPSLELITGKTLQDKFTNMIRTHWGMSTDLEKAYRLILDKAISAGLSQKDMPTMLIILSDMQFDTCTTGNIHSNEIKKSFKDAGYVMPKLIFWNLNEAYTGSPASSDDEMVGLVSGFSPSLMEAILNVKQFKPLDLVLETVKRYKSVNMKNLPSLKEVDDAIIDINTRISKNNFDFSVYL